MRVIIAAAGTGGHINPAIAIANKIKKENKKAEILFIGTNRGLEVDLVPRAGYELRTIEAYGLSKKIDKENINNIIKTIQGINQAKQIIKQFEPDIVIGTGGYICGPVFVAAQRLKIPNVVHESNAYPGTAVRMLAKRSDAVLVGFKEAKDRLKRARKVVVTGTPTKVKKLNIDNQMKKRILQELGIETHLPIVLIFGGSQGAKAINDSIINIIRNKLNVGYQIIWSAGQTQYEFIKRELALENINVEKLENVKIFPYIYNMEEVMNVVDLVIARSGAMTITEISNIGKPAIFIPLPNVSNNHQEYNARVLVNIGAAEIIQNEDLNETILNNKVKRIIQNQDLMKRMGELANRIAIDNVEDRIYQEIYNVIATK